MIIRTIKNKDVSPIGDFISEVEQEPGMKEALDDARKWAQDTYYGDKPRITKATTPEDKARLSESSRVLSEEMEKPH